MYIVKIYNNGIETEIHGPKAKLKSGSAVKSTDNTIASFTFAMNPANPGFDKILDYKTLVSIYNTNRKRYEFQGRVLCSSPEMDESGLISKEVVCESRLGFLCDSKQKYVTERNWTVNELWSHIIACHNEQVEDFKQFALGEITVEDKNDNLYLGIQREDTWQTIKGKLIDKLGGEIRLRVVDGVNYIDHLANLGVRRATEIALSHNMKAIRQENDPTAYISRLIPLGAKIVDEEGNETEERLDITSVNGGLDYIEDLDAKEAHGIRVDYAYFDDVTDPSNLKSKGEAFIRENNRVKAKYSITSLDLSLLGLDIDDFEVGDYYSVVNGLLGIDDVARIIKKTIDVCDETKTAIEVGDKFKTLSETQSSQTNKVNNLTNSVSKIENSYVSVNRLVEERKSTNALLGTTESAILAMVEEAYSKKTTVEEFEKILRAELEVWKEGISGRVSTTETSIQNVNGVLQSKFTELAKYFSFTINGLEIGATYVDESGEEKQSPNRVIIDNDEISILVYGVPVQTFKADGTALVPSLKVTKMLDLLGLQLTEDETHINCDYMEVE